MDQYQVEDVVALIEALLLEVPAERRATVAEETHVDDIVAILKGVENASQEEVAEAPMAVETSEEGDAPASPDEVDPVGA